MKKILLLTTIIGLSACASNPDKMAASYVSPIQFEGYSCKQLGAEAQRVNRKASDLHGALKKEAGNDSAQMAVGLVLFWPALFFLEGGDGPQAAEYQRLKGEYEAIEQVSIKKNCGLEFQRITPPVAEPVKTTPTTND